MLTPFIPFDYIFSLHPIRSLILLAVFFDLPPLSVSVFLVPLSPVALGSGPVCRIPYVRVMTQLGYPDDRL